MSAIVSLLRVMTVRDAEAITLEAGRVPTLRRRGNVEALAMPALEAAWLDDFAKPLLADRSLDEGPLMVSFTDEDGATYPVTIERGANGLRIVARRGGKPAPKAAPPPPAAPQPQLSVVRDEPAPRIETVERASDVRERLGQLLAGAIAHAHERRGSDVFLSTGQRP